MGEESDAVGEADGSGGVGAYEDAYACDTSGLPVGLTNGTLR